MRETDLITPSETGHVLIADDQMHVLDALQMLLGGCGFSTEVVTHPARLLSALETGRFDAVLMDLNTLATPRRVEKVWIWCQKFVRCTACFPWW